jgi:hypothetical protein
MPKNDWMVGWDVLFIVMIIGSLAIIPLQKLYLCLVDVSISITFIFLLLISHKEQYSTIVNNFIFYSM